MKGPADGRTRTWAQVWAQRMEAWNRRRTREKGALSSTRFWNHFDLWEQYETFTRYPGKLIEPVLKCIDADTTVLDIGAGTGSISLPVAGAARSVTALEPSSAQVRRLRNKLEQRGIDNVALIERRWEEVGIEETGFHDVVIASYSLFMVDIAAALRKMVEAARRKIFLVHLASHDLQRLIRETLGRGASMPDLWVLLNVLTEMGLAHQVQVFRRDFELPLDLQLDMLRYAQSFSEPQLAAIRRKLEAAGRITSRQGVPWLRRKYHDALIAIDKSNL